MLIGDIFAKLGRGETLAPAEIDFLRREMNTVQHSSSLVQRWTGTGGDPDFPFMRATRGQFDFPPLETARWRRVLTEQEIANDTWTDLEFDEETWNNTGFLTWDSGTPDEFTHASVVGYDRAFMIYGFVQFNTNNTGQRGARLSRLGSAGLIPLVFFNNVGAVDAPVLPFSIPYRITSAAVTGFTIQVYQNSGGALNLHQAYMGALRIL